jgi:hypothetical protein
LQAFKTSFPLFFRRAPASSATDLSQPFNCELLCHSPFLSTFKYNFGTGYYWHGACSGTGGWGTTLQAGRLWVWFPMVSLELFIDIILPATLLPRGQLRL